MRKGTVHLHGSAHNSGVLVQWLYGSAHHQCALVQWCADLAQWTSFADYSAIKILAHVFYHCIDVVLKSDISGVGF